MNVRSVKSAARLQADAARHCAARGLTFTPLRRQVYALIAAERTPVGAYDLLDRLKTEKANAAPVTVYRALDFLLEAGLIHRIDALQAYSVCEAGATDHGGMLLVCDNCKSVTEFENARLEHQIAETALAHKFHIANHLIEIRGLCSHCEARGD